MAKRELRYKARQLREAQRLSNREIRTALDNAVNLSTVTRWLKDIPLSTEERNAKRIASGLRRSNKKALPKKDWDEGLGTRAKGQLAELKVQIRALQLGVLLSRPTMDAKYDFVMDTGGRLARAQVKFAGAATSNSNGAAVAKLSRRGKKLYSEGCIDCLLVYIPVVDRIVKLLPDDFEGKSAVTIRYEPALSGSSRVIYAQDHLW